MPPKPSPSATPQTRYRNRKARDADAVRAHSKASLEYRRSLNEEEFDAARRALFLRVLDDVADVKIAARLIGMTHSAVYGRASWDTEFQEAMEEILSVQCIARETDSCGSAMGYKRGGRCRKCRAAHRPA